MSSGAVESRSGEHARPGRSGSRPRGPREVHEVPECLDTSAAPVSDARRVGQRPGRARSPIALGAWMRIRTFVGQVLGIAILVSVTVTAADRKIVLVAGTPSHGPGEHEHRAGCLLLKHCLDQVPGIQAVVVTNGWPKDESVFTGAAEIVFYADGGGGHPAIQADRLKKIGALVKAGTGIACIHYGVEVPKEKGGPEFLDWIGGYFEMNWSVNPHWDAHFATLPDHPITRGVKAFSINDEWYYHMRFREGMKGVIPILTSTPPASTLSRPDGTHSGNPAVREAVRKGEPQHVAWAFERPDGGRGFGFTGAHFHRNWGDENFRRLVLNALLWVAKVEVRAGGVSCAVSPEELKQDLDPKGR